MALVSNESSRKAIGTFQTVHLSKPTSRRQSFSRMKKTFKKGE